ncbi:MAG: hypothetical protein ABI540_09955 [Spartobacteria bacterium]
MKKAVPPEQRLTILRATDRERRWPSLDDKRACVVCERIFNGHEVVISGKAPSYSLGCPTPGCPSTFSHWFLIHLGAEKATPSPPLAATGEFSFFPRDVL